jgi:hypothetical protein
VAHPEQPSIHEGAIGFRAALRSSPLRASADLGIMQDKAAHEQLVGGAGSLAVVREIRTDAPVGAAPQVSGM